ncbi:LysR family transcriptional regulator ArgP [Lentibacter algarum]|uniref:LysR family transcriptional regulator ArgP n=1 Tax=Lentibacter algarum TaxID=576131 RepID=UPI001C0784E1|nr:LysR family transcriptional regulator ArgP [Lentibacter algarum]MBU2980749.1 LysR family transcriptional regulator ArgP [Lentibacter algarum]
MNLDPRHLNALTAILRSGSFEAAAQELGLTQSAVSQRLSALESQIGHVLVLRETPCHATEVGHKIAAHALTLELMEAHLVDGLSGANTPKDAEKKLKTIRFACNADSLDSWLMPAFAKLPDTVFDLVVDDQDHALDWLRRGEVAAALTSYARPVQGCDVTALGAVRYIAAASPAYVERWFGEGVSFEGLSKAPMLRFNPKDDLQFVWMQQRFNKTATPPYHTVPSTAGFAKAAELGMGWGMIPEPMITKELAQTTLVPLDEKATYDLALYVQHSRMLAGPLAPLLTALKQAAKGVLHPTH